MANTRRDQQTFPLFHLPSDLSRIDIPRHLSIISLLSFSRASRKTQDSVKNIIKNRIQFDFQLSDENFTKLIDETKNKNQNLSDYQLYVLIYKNLYETHYKKLSPLKRRLIILTNDGDVETIQKEFPNLTIDQIINEDESSNLLNIFSIARFHHHTPLLHHFYNIISAAMRKDAGTKPINEYFYKGYNLLHLALLSHCPLEDLIHLINHDQFNIDTPSQNKNFGSPLRIAVKTKNIEAIRFLISSNAKVENIIQYVASLRKDDTKHKKILDVIFEEIEIAIVKSASAQKIKVSSCFFQNDLNILHWAVACKKELLDIENIITKYQLYDAAVLSNSSLALHFAAQSGYLEAVQFFIEKWKSPIDGGRACSRTPLGYAVLSNHGGVVRYLLEKGALEKEKLYDEEHPLLIALLYNHTECAELIIKKSPDIINDISRPFQIGDKNVTVYPLSIAVLKKNHRIVEALVTAGANVNQRSIFNHQEIAETAIYYAATSSNQTETFTYLLQHGATINQDLGKLMLAYGAGYNNRIVVKTLLDSNIPTEHDEANLKSALMATTDLSIAEMLIKAGANVNCTKWQKFVLQHVIEMMHKNPTEIIKIIELLLQHNVDLKSVDYMIFAIKYFLANSIPTEHCYTLIKVLVTHDVPCNNALNHLKTLPLQQSSGYSYAILSHLCDLKPNESTLEFTVDFNQTALFMSLLTNGITFNPETGARMLRNAVKNNNSNIVEALLQRKVFVNCRPPEKSALVLTTEPNIIQMLVNAGADVNHFSGEHPNQKSVLEHFISQFHTNPKNILTIILTLLKKHAYVGHPDCLKSAMNEILTHEGLDKNLCHLLIGMLVTYGAPYESTLELIETNANAHIYIETILYKLSELRFDSLSWLQMLRSMDLDTENSELESRNSDAADTDSDRSRSDAADTDSERSRSDAADTDSERSRSEAADTDSERSRSDAADIDSELTHSADADADSDTTSDNSEEQEDPIDTEFFKMIPEARSLRDSIHGVDQTIANIQYHLIVKTFQLVANQTHQAFIKVEINGKNLLHHAFDLEQNIEIIEALINEGANLELCSEEVHSPALLALKYNLTALESMLKHGLSPDFIVSNESLLTAAMELESSDDAIKACKILIENKANVNLCDNNGSTPLMAALSRTPCHPDLVSLLLKNGAKVIDLPLQISPLGYAINCKYKKTTRIILRHMLESYVPQLGMVGWTKKYCKSDLCSKFIMRARENNRIVTLLENIFSYIADVNVNTLSADKMRFYKTHPAIATLATLGAVLLGIKSVNELDSLSLQPGYFKKVADECRELIEAKNQEKPTQSKAI